MLHLLPSRRLWQLLVPGLALAAVPVLAGGDTKKPPAPSPAAIQFFETKVRPILAENCFSCHGEKKHRGDLRLDSLSAALEGGGRGPALVPGFPEKSLLVKAISHNDKDLKMPQDKKLSRDQIEALTQWIKIGAPWPGGDNVAGGVKKGEFVISDKDRAHWSLQPVKRPTVPAVKNEHWVKNPIDAFIFARLEAKGLTPNPPAPKQELLRRITYDLTGLPPTPAEVAAFLSDASPDAYAKLVDRLLDSPRYGEKWARHWLDLVRYAETNSFERDNPKPHVWRYRDYVIRAFNSDKPYDLFLKEQLAGDELGRTDADAIIATGYYRLGLWDDEPVDPAQARYDGLDDIVATTGQVMLGLTFDCARCHNHKIDPIAQKDYYRLLAFFHNINHFRNGGPTDEAPILATPADAKAFEEQQRELEKKRQQVQDEIAIIEAEFRTEFEKEKGAQPSGTDFGPALQSLGPTLLGKERFSAYQKLRKQLDTLRKQQPSAERALCVTEAGPSAPETFVMLRGNPHVKGDKVEPGFPTVFNLPDPTIPAPRPAARSSGRRLVLANWIASKDNPLAARVMVNRLWQHHFGRGIVRSPNDFGLNGNRPTHPELLDWLASQFVESGWRMKAMHRLILTSNAYRMSSRGNLAVLDADPINDLFWRFDMRRLSGEEIRDSILAVSGNLNLKMFGPSVYPEIPKEVLAGQSVPGRGWPVSPPDEQNRRSVYVHVKRSLLLPILESFDLAETDRTTPVRFSTTQPTQALGMLNGDFLNKQARVFATRLRKEAGDEAGAQVRLALALATCRTPSDKEIHRGMRFMQALVTEEGATREAALEMFCLLVLNMNEFVYLD
jgi:hypothetical protein